MGDHIMPLENTEYCPLAYQYAAKMMDEFKDIYSTRFDAHTTTIADLFSDTNGILTGNKLTKITATDDMPVASSDDFFEAYTLALRDVFVDLVGESPELIQHLG